jgi:DNA-binding response OmpR family regulator
MMGMMAPVIWMAQKPAGVERRRETMRILLVEDEERLADTIARGLRHEGMAVDVVLDGKSAVNKAAVSNYDVIVLDRNLPVMHGDDVCRELVSRQSLSRILMLTAAGSIQDRVTGLDLGADDYLPKPFALKELVARIRALSRRTAAPTSPVLVAGDLTLDPARHTAERAGKDLGLTKKEFGVLEVLLSAEGRVVSAEELLERVWDENADPFTNVVRVTIMTLRRKIGDPPLIETVAGVGYKI